jgi:error-prone DNA polymerase
MGFYEPAQLVRDAREHGVEVRAPDALLSDWDCTLEDSSSADGMSAVRLGLRLVAGLAEEEAKKIVAARQAGAGTLEEIARRAGLARGVLERVAEADAFREQGLDRRAAFWRATGLKAERRIARDAPLLERIAPDAGGDDDLLPAMPLPEQVAEDYRSIGLSLKAHPVSFFRDALDRRRVVRAADLERVPEGAQVRVAGLVLNRQRPGTAKNVMFATLEDETGVANLVIWDRVFQANRRVMMTSGFLLAEGVVQKASGVIHVIVERPYDLTRSLRKLKDGEEPGFKAGRGPDLGEDPRQKPLQRSRDFH